MKRLEALILPNAILIILFEAFMFLQDRLAQVAYLEWLLILLFVLISILIIQRTDFRDSFHKQIAWPLLILNAGHLIILIFMKILPITF